MSLTGFFMVKQLSRYYKSDLVFLGSNFKDKSPENGFFPIGLKKSLLNRQNTIYTLKSCVYFITVYIFHFGVVKNKIVCEKVFASSGLLLLHAFN